MAANDGKANALAAGWPYAGYRVTVFSTGEEAAALKDFEHILTSRAA